MKKIEFTEQMKILTMAYSNNYSQQELELWYEYFMDVDYASFKNAIKDIIKTSKYKPSISELLERCEQSKTKRKFDILEKMTGVFSHPDSADVLSKLEHIMKMLDCYEEYEEIINTQPPLEKIK